jgi:hypothetical protein
MVSSGTLNSRSLDTGWGGHRAIVGSPPGRSSSCPNWTLGTLELDSLQLFTMKGNVASERVAAKAGFQVVEVIPDKDFGSKRAT